jgi:orotidine-5'-phosphate decarboxylase
METATLTLPPVQATEAPAPADRLEPRDRLIVALDFASAAAAMELVDELQGTCRWFKVGLELYCAAGNSVVEHLRARGFDVFLDLKLHDIPHTVAAAVRTLERSGASLLTVHAAGGERMLRAAVEAASAPDSPRLLAVTVLTSMDQAQLSTVGIGDAGDAAGGNLVEAQVLRLARLAKTAGIDRLVCGAAEVNAVCQAIGRSPNGDGPLLVVPGIRPAGAEAGDQRRVATPAQAIADGASMLVVGRPITQAADPARAAAGILAEIAAGA